MSVGRQISQAVKELKGTDQRPTGPLPQPKLGLPIMPKSLSKAAKPIWVDICRLLSEMECLSVADSYAVESLSECMAEVRMHRKSLYADGNLSTVSKLETPNGTIYKARPEVTMIHQADHLVNTWIQKLGLSPTDRNKLSKIVNTETNDFGDL